MADYGGVVANAMMSASLTPDLVERHPCPALEATEPLRPLPSAMKSKRVSLKAGCSSDSLLRPLATTSPLDLVPMTRASCFGSPPILLLSEQRRSSGGGSDRLAYAGRHTEISGTARIERDSAFAAFAEFMETGRQPECIEWRET
jgi:immunity protein Imm1 of predicted polymorphic toxin system